MDTVVYRILLWSSNVFLNVWRVQNDIFFFIPAIGNLCPYFLVILAKDLPILLIFLKNYFLSFLYYFCFVLLISALTYVISILLFALNLFCSTVYSFIRWKLINLRPFLFHTITIWCYRFPSKHCFNWNLQVLMFYFFIFVQFKTFSKILWDFSLNFELLRSHTV